MVQEEFSWSRLLPRMQRDLYLNADESSDQRDAA